MSNTSKPSISHVESTEEETEPLLQDSIFTPTCLRDNQKLYKPVPCKATPKSMEDSQNVSGPVSQMATSSPTSSEEDGLQNWWSPSPLATPIPSESINKSSCHFKPIKIFEEIITSSLDGFDELIDDVLLELYQDKLLHFNPVEVHPTSKMFTFDQVKKIISKVYSVPIIELNVPLCDLLNRLFFDQVTDIPPVLAWTHPTLPTFSLKQIRTLIRAVLMYHKESEGMMATQNV